jgi:arylsulfatase A-like enzyme
MFTIPVYFFPVHIFTGVIALSSSQADFSESSDSNNHSQKEIFTTSLYRYALAGVVTAFLLSLMEWLDLQIQLTPVFASFTERIIFTAYFSLNLLVGALVGLLAGLFVQTTSFVKNLAVQALSQGKQKKPWQNLFVGFVVFILAAILLKQQPHLHGYMIELIREAEKIEPLRDFLLNHERAASYAVMFGFILFFWILWHFARRAGSLKKPVKAGFFFILALLIVVAYTIDSRVEVQLYDPSLHRTLFILTFAFMMTLVGAIYFSSSPTLQRLKIRQLSFDLGFGIIPAPVISIGVIILLLAAVAFTFNHFDKNQNLKNQIVFRTTQTRQHIRLIQWAMDVDRDGWSAFLGGGDADDGNADINPSRAEVTGDGVDNNCIGGELTQADIEEWQRFWQAQQTAPGKDAKRLNVIYIFVDALRADHLGAYGYTRNTSPNIDKLAAKAQLFENGFTPSPNTFEAMPKFTQGNYWDAHLEGWPEILVKNGYNGLAFPRRLPVMLRHVKGMKVVQEARVRTFQETIDIALRVLNEAPKDRPFAAYLYATDTHRPYKRHAQFDFGSSLIDLYDGEVAYVDYHLGRLFDWMESAGRMKDTMILLMADHGESLGERGMYKHSSLLYNEQLRIPYLIYVPEFPPRRIPDYVSSVDLGPTILNTLGIEYPQACTGVSLLPLIKNQPFEHPPVYAEQTYRYQSFFVRPDQNVSPDTKKYAVITQDGYKLIYNRNPYSFELYNLKSDPREERNLFNSEPERAQAMKKLVGRYVDMVVVSRPWDADESQYVWGQPEDRDIMK